MLQTILSVAVVQLDIYSDKLLSFPHSHIAHIFALKKARYERFFIHLNPAKRNVLDLKNETCKNREKRNVLKKSHTRHFKAIKKQSKTGCFYSF